MKLIIAIIQPTKLEAVKDALSQVEVFRLTVTDVQGFGRQKGYTEVYRGHEITVNLLRKVELQIAVNEDFVEPTVNAIIQAGRSGPDGKIGDGKIFILPDGRLHPDQDRRAGAGSHLSQNEHGAENLATDGTQIRIGLEFFFLTDLIFLYDLRSCNLRSSRGQHDPRGDL